VAERLPPAAEVSIVVRDWLDERNKRYFTEKNAQERMRGRA
jgi:hypothetical protein